jgi:glutamate dehydrogenase/leucine dehydrogenase
MPPQARLRSLNLRNRSLPKGVPLEVVAQRKTRLPAFLRLRKVRGGVTAVAAAPGRGAAHIAMLACRDLLPDAAGPPSVVVQGYGQVGGWAARCAAASGATVIAVSDIEGGIYNPKGLDLDDVDSHRATHRGLAGFPGAEHIDNSTLLELECDILIPAAIEEVITSQNAGRIRAAVVVEAANAPVTFEADRILNERGVHVLPDILANAGGVIVSYFEWAQNIQEFRWQEDRVNQELLANMTKAYDAVRKQVHETGVTHREASYAIAVSRVAQAIRLRGFV